MNVVGQFGSGQPEHTHLHPLPPVPKGEPSLWRAADFPTVTAHAHHLSFEELAELEAAVDRFQDVERCAMYLLIGHYWRQQAAERLA